MLREKGPYYANPGQMFGQDDEADIQDYNVPPDGQPGLWCQWVPKKDGSALMWDGGEKFYHPAEWMEYLIHHFLMHDAEASKSNEDQFGKFTFDHVLNGVVDIQGEDPNDRWRLLVENNSVRAVTFPQDI